MSSSGLYAAPANAAAPVVRAASGSVTGQITLSVLAAPQLLADYAFNETGSYALYDSVASLPAYMSGGTTLVPGRMGNAVQFDGASGSVWIGQPSTLDIRGQITLAAWIKPNSTSGTQTIICRGYGPWPNQSGTFLRISSGQYQVGFFNGGYYYASYAMPAGDVGTWVHLVGTYDGKNWNLYRDGTLVATYANSTGAVYAPKSWRIGSSDAPDSYFSGAIDSVRIYGQALSATAVGALYNQTISVASPAAATPVTGTTFQPVGGGRRSGQQFRRQFHLHLGCHVASQHGGNAGVQC